MVVIDVTKLDDMMHLGRLHYEVSLIRVPSYVLICVIVNRTLLDTIDEVMYLKIY